MAQNIEANIFSQIHLSGEVSCEEFKPNRFKKNICVNCSNDVLKHSKDSVNESVLLEALEYTQAMEKIPSLILEGKGGLGSVYLGGYKGVINLEFLQCNNITHILNTAKGLEVTLGTKFVELVKKVNKNLSIVTKETNWVDDPSFKIELSSLKEAVLFIEEARANSGNVLVHCAQGRSRSSTAVIAYIMCKNNMKSEEATTFVKKKRMMASPNPGFEKILSTFYQSPEFNEASEKLKTCN
ncbi:Dual specificity protein phosphatase 22-like isoform X1 [Oopsacas minuta]|uniref:protein-tyrosine-phosphatase n=1 Tax=Oopsacas minuta TaxID=111878 RepID=A0AAV7JEL0_9METZ|nr:Dual specificity protein phosphatase 22-like isoform X1 [Oopsacas minuta]